MRIGELELFSIREAARLLSVDRTTLQRQAKIGVLRAHLIDTMYVVEAEEVERYRREHLGRRGNYDHKTARRKKPKAPSV